MPKILAVDVGTSSVRAQVFEADLAEAEAVRRDYAGENDSQRVIELVRAAVDEATRDEDFEAVGGSCFGHSLLALDGQGRPRSCCRRLGSTLSASRRSPTPRSKAGTPRRWTVPARTSALDRADVQGLRRVTRRP